MNSNRTSKERAQKTKSGRAHIAYEEKAESPIRYLKNEFEKILKQNKQRKQQHATT